MVMAANKIPGKEVSGWMVELAVGGGLGALRQELFVAAANGLVEGPRVALCRQDRPRRPSRHVLVLGKGK